MQDWRRRDAGASMSSLPRPMTWWWRHLGLMALSARVMYVKIGKQFCTVTQEVMAWAFHLSPARVCSPAHSNAVSVLGSLRSAHSLNMQIDSSLRSKMTVQLIHLFITETRCLTYSRTGTS